MGRATGQWAIVELMGHKTVAGLASKDERFGTPLLRIDVPETKKQPAFSQFYGLQAVYCITPVSEQVARLAAGRCYVDPVSIYVPELVTAERHQSLTDSYQRLLETMAGSQEE